MGRGAEDILEHGIESILTCVNAPMPLEQALENAESLYLSAARRLFRLIRAVEKNTIHCQRRSGRNTGFKRFASS